MAVIQFAKHLTCDNQFTYRVVSKIVLRGTRGSLLILQQNPQKYSDINVYCCMYETKCTVV